MHERGKKQLFRKRLNNCVDKKQVNKDWNAKKHFASNQVMKHAAELSSKTVVNEIVHIICVLRT